MEPSFKTTPVVWDSGASFGLTTFCADFIVYVECDIDVRDISKFNKVVGFGITTYKLTATNGGFLSVPALSYHLPSADIQLFGSQASHQFYGGSNELDGDKVVMHLK